MRRVLPVAGLFVVLGAALTPALPAAAPPIRLGVHMPETGSLAKSGIEKVKGIIMRRLQVDEEEAFRRVRMLASSQNQKLAGVARQVIESEEIFMQLEKL